MQPFKKIVRIGTVVTATGWKDIHSSVYCKIEWTQDKKLSISGVVGPMSNGDCRGSCGQICMGLKIEDFSNWANGWDAQTLKRFLEIWDRYHLNDMVPGTPKQMAIIREKIAKISNIDPLIKEAPYAYAAKASYKSFYDMQCDWLENENLLIDDDYKFGTAWLREDVPNDALKFLYNLPDTDRTPAWV